MAAKANCRANFFTAKQNAMCNKLSIKNFELLSIPLTAGVSTYQFPTDSTINNAKKVKAMRAYYSFTGTMKSPSGATLVDAASFRSAFLEISDNVNKKPISQIPLTEIALMPNTQNPADFLNIDVDGINASKCQVVFGDTSTITTGMVLLIGVIYDI